MNMRTFRLCFATATVMGMCQLAMAGDDVMCEPLYTTGGSVSYLNVLEANAPMPCMDIGWWYFVGGLSDQQGEQHSLQLTLFRKRLTDQASVGAGITGFSFNRDGVPTYLWTGYPQDVLSAAGQFSAPKVDRSTMSIDVQGALASFHFAHDPEDTSHRIGEVGARYFITAKGLGRIGVSRLQPVNGDQVSYNFNATVVDQRGMVPEAYNGYVGTKDVHASWELGMPSLKTTHWSMQMTELTSGKHYNFSADEHVANRLWYDRQVLLHGKNSPEQQASTVLSKAASDVLYHGTWMSFCLDQAPYNGVCGVAVAFWDDGVSAKAMDSDSNAFNGFMDLYTPVSKTTQGNTLTMFLADRDNHKPVFGSPFRIKNDSESVFVDPLSAGHFAQSVTVSINPSSVIGRVLSEDSKPLSLKFEAISKRTVNVMFSESNAFYEGAAKVSICSSDGECRLAGNGFIEQMGYAQ